MKSIVKFAMLGLLLIPFALASNIDTAFAKTVTVDQCPGAANANNDCFFVPPEVTINVGDTVLWTNSDTATHTVTSGTLENAEEWGDVFDSGLGIPGSTFEHTFNEAGEYPYLCQLHPWMLGTVTVLEVAMDGDGTVGTVMVEFENNEFEVPVSLSNGKVTDIIIDPDFTSVILTLETGGSGGELMITLERELIDARYQGEDDEFIVLVDGDEADYEETETTSTERVLTIDVPAGTEEIEIVGSQVVPEFPLAVMAVMGAIIATAIVATRVRNPLRP